MVIMISSWPSCKLFLEPLLDQVHWSCGFPPPMEKLEEHVVKMNWLIEGRSVVIHVSWHIADLVDDTWSHLSDVHIDHQAVVSIDLIKLLLRKILCLNVVLDIHVLVR